MQNDDPLLTCPYNKAHQILRSRMQSHLIKCQKNYPSANKKTCPFNAIHHIDSPDYQYHITTCPDRRIIEIHAYEISDGMHGDLNSTPVYQPPVPPSDEDWDNETVATYNPLEHVQNLPILRNLAGASRSQRKHFRMQERARVQMIEDGELPNSGSSTGEGSSDSASGSNVNKFAPARLPNTRPEALEGIADMHLGMGRGGGRPGGDEPVCVGFGRGASSNEISFPIAIGRGRVPAP